MIASKGKVTFVVTPAELKAFAKRVGPTLEKGDAGATSRLKPVFSKTLVKGSKLLAFAAETTAVEPEVKKETVLRTILSNADGTCSYQKAKWVEPYTGGGLFELGRYDTVDDPTPLPCP